MASKNQMRLQLDLPTPYDYGTWLRHSGVEEACNRLALWSVHGGKLWLTSDTAAGKSHLLRTLASEHASTAMIHIQHDATGNSSQLAQHWMQSLQGQRSWLIDVPSGPIALALAHALFHILERARDQQRSIIIAWRGEMQQLPAELSSRLLGMEKIHLAPPAADEDLLHILRASAGHLQWDIREQVLQAMLTYLPRQLDILVAALKELEALSFEQKHKPGPAWVKQQLIRIADERHPRLL